MLLTVSNGYPKVSDTRESALFAGTENRPTFAPSKENDDTLFNNTLNIQKNMKETKTIIKTENATAVDFGKWNDLGQYVLQLAPEVKIPGKVFGGALVGATGGEFSFQSFAPGTETGFLHTHKNHEELYFFLSGKGEFQVDGRVFAIGEGSVVRVAPEGKRSVRNNGAEPLVMLCVQYRGATFTADDAADGVILSGKVEW